MTDQLLLISVFCYLWFNYNLIVSLLEAEASREQESSD
jgi:hypothetical protein